MDSSLKSLMDRYGLTAVLSVIAAEYQDRVLPTEDPGVLRRITILNECIAQLKDVEAGHALPAA